MGNRQTPEPLMVSTSPTLLARLRQSGEPDAWTRFVRLYSPILYTWARHMGLSRDDAADLVQDVFIILVQKLPDFEYDERGRFRGWLWTVTRNCWRDKCRRPALPVDRGFESKQLAGTDTTEEVEEAEFRRHIAVGIVPIVRGLFQESTWRAFWEHVAEGRPVADVAAELGVTVAAVYKAKARVLARLNREFGDLFTNLTQHP